MKKQMSITPTTTKIKLDLAENQKNMLNKYKYNNGSASQNK
jgi:hypothetical protein